MSEPRPPAPVPLVVALGTPHALAAAIVAAEILGPPLALRPGGTLGPRDAF